DQTSAKRKRRGRLARTGATPASTSKESAEPVHPQHCLGTLKQVLESLDVPLPKSLNCLDIPARSNVFSHQHLFSDEVAWERFDGKRGDHYPTSDMRWSLVSTGWTQHRWHEDSNGFATFIRVETGMKWWYMGKPKADLPASHRSGGIQRLLDGFDLDACNSDRLDIEVAVVDVQDMLFMRPNTLHAVITPKPSVIKGGHFLATATLAVISPIPIILRQQLRSSDDS
ncbi:hypothetical protein DXG01_014198, partial [Tephrocybe rancida]